MNYKGLVYELSIFMEIQSQNTELGKYSVYSRGRGSLSNIGKDPSILEGGGMYEYRQTKRTFQNLS